MKEEAEIRNCLKRKAVSDLPPHMSYINVSQSGLAFSLSILLYFPSIFHVSSFDPQSAKMKYIVVSGGEFNSDLPNPWKWLYR